MTHGEFVLPISDRGNTLLRLNPDEESKYQKLMESHHYLGAIPKIGESIWYAGHYDGKWVALISFSAAALQCTARDRWIGWHYRHQTGRLEFNVSF